MKSIYTIEEKEVTDNLCRVRIKLDADHAIYRAHFPGHPITPGAVLFGIASQLVAAQWEQYRDVVEAKNVKFVHPHHPQEHEHLTFAFEQGKEQVEVVISDEDTTFAKMTLIF